MAFLLIINILVVIPSLTKGNHDSLIISFSAIGTIILSFCIGRFFPASIQYFTLIAFFVFLVTRLVIIKLDYGTVNAANLYLNGYAFGAIIYIMLIYIHKVQYKACALLITYVLRMSVVLGSIDHQIVSPVLIIRHFIIDIFLIYIFYSAERTSRAVFQNFYENREELLKFKELLADALPQSVIVLECDSYKPIFSNNTFVNTFQHNDAELCMFNTEMRTSQNFLASIACNKRVPFNLLQIDVNTVRDIGCLDSGLNLITVPTTQTDLTGFISKVAQDTILNKKILSVTASCHSADSRRSFEVISRRIRWNKSDAMAFILSDITHQEHLIALKVANVNKDQIIATVSHELRTPLHGIIGLLDISQSKIDNVEAIENISLCKDNAHLLLSLVNSLLDFHQISTGKLKLNLNVIDLRETIESITRLFNYQYSQKGIYLKLDVNETLLTVVNTDENRLKQILINLIANAIKFTFKGGIRITIDQDPADNECLQIAVIDTGMGIKDEDKGRLFKMYGKLEDEEGVNKNGVGLGLTISNALVMMLNGQETGKGMEIESKYGEGCKFYFKILKDLSGRLDKESVIIEDNEITSQKKMNTSLNVIAHLATDGGFMEKADTDVKLLSLNSLDEKGDFMIDPIETKLATHTFLQVHTRKESLNDDRRLDPFFKVLRTPISSQIEICIQEESKLLESPNGRQIETNIKVDYHSATKIPTLLVVDDNPFNLLVARNLMKNLKYNIKTANGGQEAIDLVKMSYKEGETIKAIFMDCQMPIMDGFETTETLREMMSEEKIPKTPILAWSANNSEKDIKRCYECGMVGHLTKPTTQDDIARVLSEL